MSARPDMYPDVTASGRENSNLEHSVGDPVGVKCGSHCGPEPGQDPCRNLKRSKALTVIHKQGYVNPGDDWTAYILLHERAGSLKSIPRYQTPRVNTKSGMWFFFSKSYHRIAICCKPLSSLSDGLYRSAFPANPGAFNRSSRGRSPNSHVDPFLYLLETPIYDFTR